MLHLVVFICFVAIGWFVYRDYKLRKQFFESFLLLCDHMTTEIGFSKRTVSQIIDISIESYSPQFAQMLLGFRALLSNNQDITRENLSEHMWSRLKPAERAFMCDFFMELGRHGAAEELDKIARKKSRGQVFCTAATEALKRDASIYFKICILLGIAAVILLL